MAINPIQSAINISAPSE